jgi:NAD(P)-dependent dehydrogenase (short-subunit alcohol dehydrogenase family)
VSVGNFEPLLGYVLTAGAAIAIALARRGVRVAINYASNRQRAEETLSKLEGSNHVLIQGDALSKDGIRHIVQATVTGLGGLDWVVSNVGWTAFGAFKDISKTSPSTADAWRS